VDDTQALWEQWAAGLRERYGRVPVAGIPRMTRPRRRANADGASGFSLVDPSGNWVRVYQDRGAGAPSVDAAAPTSVLARAVDNAVVLADSRGDAAQALKALVGAVRRAADDTPAADRVAALALEAELEVRTGDHDAARATLTRLAALPLGARDREAAADSLDAAGELARGLHDDRPR